MGKEKATVDPKNNMRCFCSLSVTARASCSSQVIEGIRQVYQKCEGVILPVSWCDEFNFQIDDIFTRLRIAAKEKTRGNATTKELTNMTSVFTPHSMANSR